MPWVHMPKRKKGPGMWPEKKRLEVVQSYVLIGNLRKAAALNGVPEVTAKLWKTQKWFKELEADCRKSGRMELSTKLTDLVNSAMLVVADRLAGGDFIYDFKTKTFVRKPVDAQVANKIAVQLIDRNLALEKAEREQEQYTKESEEQSAHRLKLLKEEMLKFVSVKVSKPSAPIIEGEFTSVEAPSISSIPQSEVASPGSKGEAGVPIGRSESQSGVCESKRGVRQGEIPGGSGLRESTEYVTIPDSGSPTHTGTTG